MRQKLSLFGQRHPLAAPRDQLRVLHALPDLPRFETVAGPVKADRVDVLQVNVGKRCNQSCAHCHVDAGPDREEVMPDVVIESVLEVLARERIPTLDITGGAPELHPRFEDLVVRARAAGARVIDRCNLTVLTTPRYAHLPAFFADHAVEVVCSLPSPTADRTDAQRGTGVFDKSIDALRSLNAVGYGIPGTGRELVVVSNPTGAFMPPPQAAFDSEFRAALARHGVSVSRVVVLTNMPIARYLEWLERSGNTARYVERLLRAFNASSLPGLMCRTQVSVGFDGRLYDCDFNQMLELGLEHPAPATVMTWAAGAQLARKVRTDVHCFGCTAGQGSSCGGALTHEPQRQR